MTDNEQSSDVEVLERGSIYFLFRPKVERHDPKGSEDVQRFYLVLSPHGKTRYRLLVVGRKELPDPEAGRQPHWAFVEGVYDDAKQLSEKLRAEVYSTKTRGEREVPSARPAGEGAYEIISHDGHTHLAYVLELPGKPGEVQSEFHIEPEASYVIQVKNPEKPPPKGVGLPPHEVELPEKLQKSFEGRRFSDVDPPEFLDHEGIEMIFVAASSKLTEELAESLTAETDEEDRTADVFSELRLHRAQHPVEPLFEGRWE